MTDDVLFSFPDEPAPAAPRRPPRAAPTPPTVTALAPPASPGPALPVTSAPALPAPPSPGTASPVVRLLALADQFTQHNDLLARLRPAYGAARGHASAAFLASACTEAVQAIQGHPIPATAAVEEATIRIKQLAYLTAGAAHHLAEAKGSLGAPASVPEQARATREISQQIALAQELTALGPIAAVEAATTIAVEIHRSSPGTAAVHLTPAERTALHAAARGHLAIGGSGDREHVHSRSDSVRIDTVLALEQRGLTSREPTSAPPAFDGGPPPDRVRLTFSGAMAVAAQLGRAPHASALTTTPVPSAHVTPAPARTR
ncbi:hypothetical protein [Streptomyces antarcticus]|uniref:hypothetical protein n=1 Tax=Streptomyces antarcticus TaxID=2996458 RepID=UPI00226E1DB8|nr:MULTISPECIES: hypothetical protein [unclassified Streptomyces]MCY0942323.1 hypothetical protein [Streptomyces sp. H34-AA3]MCZ4080680.1 hypothetical protein [Streptomyces sp. H34-S5]